MLRRILFAVLLLAPCVQPSHAQSAALPQGVLRPGSLANQQLIRDALQGVAGKAATLGCTRMLSFEPYVLAMPVGAPGSRVWRERWIVSCANRRYPIDIRFNEAGLQAADWTIE